MNKNEIIKEILSWVRKNQRIPSQADLELLGIPRKDLRRLFGNLAGALKCAQEKSPTMWAKVVEISKVAPLKERAVSGYVELSTALSRPPTVVELADHVKAHPRAVNVIGTMPALHELAVKEYPTQMASLFTDESFTPKRLKDQLARIKKHKRFLLTTAVAGCQVDKACYASLQQLCKEQDRLPMFLPIADPARPTNQNKNIMFFDTILKDEVFIFDDISLNENCYISNILTSAKQISPTTGLARIGKRSGTFIYASSKLALKSVANSHETPLMVIATGAITKPDYNTDKYMSNRTAYIATHDHTMSAILVDVVDNETFHWRPIEFDSKGGIADLGKLYSGVKPSRVIASVMVMPDGHIAEEDPDAVAAFEEMRKMMEPFAKVSHDTFDGFSVNLHNSKRHNTRAKQYKGSLQLGPSMDLEEEICQYVRVLNDRVKPLTKFYEVASNHAERIDRWVEDGAYVKDLINYEIGHELAGYMLKGQNPLEAAARKRGLSDKVVFLKRDESLKLFGVELGYHGDLGAHGSRGSLQQMNMAVGKSVSGHTHVEEIFGQAWSVGTASKLRQGWNKGFSAWVATVCFVYDNGARQTLRSIKGKWR